MDDGTVEAVDTPVGWPSAIVACAVVVLIGAITVAAVITYDTPEEALKIWASMSAVVGLLTGAFVTSFFTRGALESAKDQELSAKREMIRQARVAEVTRSALLKAAGYVPEAKWSELMNDPAMRAATTPGFEGKSSVSK